jgi:hypothetical protein
MDRHSRLRYDNDRDIEVFHSMVNERPLDINDLRTMTMLTSTSVCSNIAVRIRIIELIVNLLLWYDIVRLFRHVRWFLMITYYFHIRERNKMNVLTNVDLLIADVDVRREEISQDNESIKSTVIVNCWHTSINSHSYTWWHKYKWTCIYCSSRETKQQRPVNRWRTVNKSLSTRVNIEYDEIQRENNAEKKRPRQNVSM